MSDKTTLEKINELLEVQRKQWKSNLLDKMVREVKAFSRIMAMSAKDLEDQKETIMEAWENMREFNNELSREQEDFWREWKRHRDAYFLTSKATLQQVAEKLEEHVAKQNQDDDAAASSNNKRPRSNCETPPSSPEDPYVPLRTGMAWTQEEHALLHDFVSKHPNLSQKDPFWANAVPGRSGIAASWQARKLRMEKRGLQPAKKKQRTKK